MAEDRILSQLLKTTYEIRMDLIQVIMHKAREQSKPNSNPDQEFWDQITEKLWTHLNSGFKKFDDQLLCATCFYTVIRFSNKSAYYLDEILQLIEQELIRRQLYKDDASKTALAVSMTYGLFQSPFLTQEENENIKKLRSILRASFNLLIQIGYEYTQYTFIVFKTIRMFKKVYGTKLQEYIFDKANQIRLLNLVNHNWENPITGIRDQNRVIFQTLMSTVDKEMYTKILEEIDGFYWNKAKYLMLSVIIQYSNDIPVKILQKKLINGLIYSLYNPGLVSAGADMYYEVLKTINSEQKWCDLFLDSIMEIFKEPSIKSIENFSNYWCLTTLKTFPKIMYIILDEAECTRNNENFMFNYLCIMKHGNKLGLLDNTHKLIILQGLEDINPKNRVLAFDIVCVLQGKMLPIEQDYQLILQFLYNNINTDCTVLRLGMLGSINNFLTQLHVLFLNNSAIHEDDASIEKLVSFCKQLQEFIISSLTLNGNYQRKITCIKLCNIFITTLSEVHRKKRDQTKQAKKLIIEFLAEKQSWLLFEQKFVMKLVNLLRDPADDIREYTRKLILNHYFNVIKDTSILNNLVENALASIKSIYFYEISCGQTMFRLICELLLKDELEDGIFKNIVDIFHFAKSELITEFKLQRNIMESIENGKQMHSFISILLVILETCICNSRKLVNLDYFVHELLNILEDITNKFSWDHKKSTSSDFSKMNEMVQDIIINSGYNPNDCDDQTKISGLHQIVLNCLWLNVKASCDLASVLVQYYTNSNNDVCKKCLNLITYVLETSRHKGVIEAAGAALGRCIQHLTFENSELSDLPMILLKTKLDEIMSDTNKMSSITRRGAGLSIMVHRIVSSDMRKDKPLFHHFMKTLLRICNKIDDVPIMMDNQNLEDQSDLPKALYIHFLTRIVTDSSLTSDMLYYSTELSTLAFSKLINPHWQIRNAALQLYGALVPKLVGQNKPSGTEDETIATVACDELRTHSPKLWAYIMEILQSKDVEHTNLLLTHSNYVPILNMLANSAKRYNFSYDTNGMDWEKQLLQNLVTLLGSPIFTVRRLTAKCIFNIYTLDNIFDLIFSLEYMTENLLHGALMLIEVCHRYYSLKYHNQFKKLQEKFRKVIATGSHYYPSIEIYENVFCNVDLNQKEIVKTFLELYQYKQAPGIIIWAHNRINKYIMKASWDQILDILKIVRNQNDFEKCCEVISEKLEVNIELSETVVKRLVQLMVSFKINKSSNLIWEIIFKISLKFDLSSYIDIAKLMDNLVRKDMFKIRYMIPLIATVLLNIDEIKQIQFTTLVSSLSAPDNANVDMRHIAIIANNEIAKHFYYVNDSVRVTAIKTAVVFLQDEDSDLRNQSTHFYKNLIKAQSTAHAYLCLNKILDPEFLGTLFDNPQVAVKKLCKDLDEVIKINMICNVDDYNPFANDTKNIYLEAELLKTFILKIKNKIQM